MTKALPGRPRKRVLPAPLQAEWQPAYSLCVYIPWPPPSFLDLFIWGWGQRSLGTSTKTSRCRENLQDKFFYWIPSIFPLLALTVPLPGFAKLLEPFVLGSLNNQVTPTSVQMHRTLHQHAWKIRPQCSSLSLVKRKKSQAQAKKNRKYLKLDKDLKFWH